MGGSAGKLIDFRRRASELRIKSTLGAHDAVSASEAARSESMGLRFLQGEGVGKDLSKAATFLAVAAKGGVARAKHELALLYLEGNGVSQDAGYAISLLESASADGHAASTISLAEVYIFGKHAGKNIEKALDLLYQVVFENEPAAMYYLAYIYDRDHDHHNDFEAAYWYRRAAEHGHFKSQLRLASLYATGQGVPHCPETAEAFLGVAMESTVQQEPEFLYWQGARLGAQPETEFLGEALIKAAAAMKYTPAQRLLLERGWRA